MTPADLALLRWACSWERHHRARITKLLVKAIRKQAPKPANDTKPPRAA